MADISNKNRTFTVYLDKQVAGHSASEETVEVPAGEDADEVCNEVLQVMISNELDVGWVDSTPEEPKKPGKKKR